jgi:hypothetical protein
MLTTRLHGSGTQAVRAGKLAADARIRKTGTASSPNVVPLNRSVRPRRADILNE